MAQMDSEAGKGGGERPRCAPDLRQNLEELAEAVRAWGDSLGIEAGYYDPRIEEGGSNDWGGALRRATKDALKVAMSLLVVRGGADLANDLGGRLDRLHELADAYQEALEALEDEARVHIEGLASRFRAGFGSDREPELWAQCKGIGRTWTFWADGNPLETVEQFAEAIDKCSWEEDGAKRRRQAEVREEARDLADHVELLATASAGAVEPPDAGADQPEATPPATPRDEPEELSAFGGPQVDLHDSRVVNWFGKRLYLGDDTQVSRLFWLLAERPCVAHHIGEVQQAVDGMETDPIEQGEKAHKKAMNRVAKALSKLRKHLREHKLDHHVLIVKEGERDWPTYTMFLRFGKS